MMIPVKPAFDIPNSKAIGFSGYCSNRKIQKKNQGKRYIFEPVGNDFQKVVLFTVAVIV
jgi:hypothetical protein